MELRSHFTTIAATEYNCDAYGAGAYGQCDSSNGLANTGYDMMVPIALGLSVIIASLILLAKRLWRRRKSTS